MAWLGLLPIPLFWYTSVCIKNYVIFGTVLGFLRILFETSHEKLSFFVVGWDLFNSQMTQWECDLTIFTSNSIAAIYRQSSVKTPPIKNTSSNNTPHIFSPFLRYPQTTLAIVVVTLRLDFIQRVTEVVTLLLIT